MNNITIKIVLVAIFLATFSSIASASNVKGKVAGYDANRKSTPLRNARIVALPSMQGVMSSAAGEFSLEVREDDSLLVVSSAGYTADTLVISNITDKLNVFIQLENIELEGINVTGSKVATTLDFSGGMRTETITTRGLQKAACCNLSESFTTTPSVDVQYSDAITGSKRIQLLGLQSIYTQFQQKNIPMMRGLASNYGFAFVPGQWLHEISISKGAATVKNGFESITGLINIDYKLPEHENPTTLNFYINDMPTFEINADHSVRLSDDVHTTLFVHGNYFNREIDHNNDGFLDKPMGNQINILNRWEAGTGIWESRSDFQFMIDDRKGGQMNYHNGNNNDSLWGMRVKTNRYNANIRNGFMLGDEGANIGTLLSFTHHKQDSYFGNRVFNAEQNSFYANIMFQLPSGASHNDEHHSEHIFSNSNLTSGISLQYDNYRELFDSFNYDKLLRNNNDANVMVPGLFVEYAFGIFNNLNIIAGLRGDIPIINYDTIAMPKSDEETNKVLLTPRIHLKYGIIPDKLVFAASVGRGWRVARELAENSSYLASNRNYILQTHNTIEEAYNYGANMYWTFNLFGCPVDFNMDFYRTDFINQLVVDLDKSPDEVHLYKLDANDKSYSNAFQVDATFQPITNFFITAAYRMNDVKQTTADELRDKPLQSKHKSFLNFQYNTEMNEWAFDFTIDYNGSGRLPMDANGVIKRYDPFVLMNAQVTKAFKFFDIYIGGENLTNYRIKDAIKGNLTPFASGFDASMIYGPVTGICVYLGIRYKIY